jgi:hypothetical protein
MKRAEVPVPVREISGPCAVLAIERKFFVMIDGIVVLDR